MSIAAENRETCLKVTDLKMYFPVKSGIFSKARSLKAVDGVSFSIAQGETMGLVGESGCGKTTVGRTILKLYEATGGSITYKGTDITGFDDQEMRPYRRKMQMIFQDPYTSLDPRMNVEAIISEPGVVYLPEYPAVLSSHNRLDTLATPSIPTSTICSRLVA